MGVIPKRMTGQTPSHARSKIQEKETADRIGGKTVHRSGAGLIKGDVRVKHIMRVENKTTKHKSYSVSVETLDKLENAVAGSDELPVMQIELNGGTHKFLIVPDLYLEEIVEALKFYHASMADKNT